MTKALVAYFSVSGGTAGVAKRLANAIGADIFEIKAAQPYTKEDLDWNKNSRSNVEMRDPSCRPAIAERIDNMDDYAVVFIGFPIWWYREPSIVDTFLDAYSFVGKTIVPFCTSGGSGMGDTEKNMQSVVKNGRVTVGKRFEKTATEDELKNWAMPFIK